MVKYRKMFIANPVGRFDSMLDELADEVVAVCPTPMYDGIVEDEETAAIFKSKINKVMDTFDPDTDVVLDYGDPLIFAMIIYYLADHDKITVGRYNRKTEKYIFHAIDEWWIKGDENGHDSPRH